MTKRYLLGIPIALAGVLFWVTTHSVSVYAATPPDDCFAFSAGVVSAYYDNRGNNPANSACPRDVDIPSTIGGVAVTRIGSFSFQGKDLTAVTIPSTVTSIGASAFQDNQLAALILPNSVQAIESSAFHVNRLTTVTLSNSLAEIEDNVFGINRLASIAIPNSVTRIGQYAFQSNFLTNVTIPDSVITTESGAFSLQGFDQDTNDSTGVHYAQLYTETPSNPNNLQDDANVFDFGSGPQNFGGHLINPAKVTTTYKNTGGDTIAPTVTSTGILDDGTNIPDYLVANGPQMADGTTGPDPALQAYHRLGQTYQASAPNVSGYDTITPSSPHTVTLANTANTVNFVYSVGDDTNPTDPSDPGNPANPTTPSQPGSPTGTDERLVDTGVNLWTLMLVASVATLGGSVLGVRLLTSRKI